MPQIARWDTFAELEFFHPERSVGHAVHANACRAKKVDALFFMLGWAQCDFHKKRTRTRHTELML
jgi:hypothetical protein